MSQVLYSISPAGVKKLLEGAGQYVAPAQLLGDLTEAQAVKNPPAAPYSIAQILSHMHYWQGVEIARATGKIWRKAKHLDETFASIKSGTWGKLVKDFLSDLETLKKLADEKPKNISPSRDDTELNYDLAGTAIHNAYHFGQIVLLRRLQGLWPPKGGEDYDF
jgi:hypothetical protein